MNSNQTRYAKTFLKDLITCRLKEREGEREEEKHQCVVASLVPPTGDLAPNPGMCPDWELHQQLLVQSTEPRQPGLVYKDFFFDLFLLSLLNSENKITYWKLKIRAE